MNAPFDGSRLHKMTAGAVFHENGIDIVSEQYFLDDASEK